MFHVNLKKTDFQTGLFWAGFFLHLLFLSPLFSYESGVYAMTDRLSFIRGIDSEISDSADLKSYLKLDDWKLSQWDNGIDILYFKSVKGRIPVLCFHKLGEGSRYIITADNTRKLMKYLDDNRFHVISDRDFIRGNFSEVPSGYKPVVLGSDDASYGNIIYKAADTEVETELNGSGIRDWTLTEDSLASILMDNVPPDRFGLIPFTFYISFDGIPFRQTGGFKTGGIPFVDNPVVQQKIRWASRNFYLGYHTLTHPVTKNTAPKDFIRELELSWDAFYEVLGADADKVQSLAYPYGCQDLNPELKQLLMSFKPEGAGFLAGGFDYDGYFSVHPDDPSFDRWDVSRLGIDNRNFTKVLGFLESVPITASNRLLVVRSDDSAALAEGIMKPGELLYVLKEQAVESY